MPAGVEIVLPSSWGQAGLPLTEPVDVGEAAEDDDVWVDAVAEDDAAPEDVAAAEDETGAVGVVVI